ncbi:MAG: zinc-ribbon domain-containing protein [Dehalococcoidia bacterium]|nr:zinc-ribbon domain-containing protein [Dehalococcoidia bacterium]
MFCSKCGKETADNAAFCASCGASLAGGQPAKKKTQLSLAAGIIDIAAGAFSIISMLGMAIFLFVMFGTEEEIPFFVVFFPLAMLIPGIIAVVGGIFALRRRSWVMALVGSIALIVTSSLLGVAALVLTIMARDEFE